MATLKEREDRVKEIHDRNQKIIAFDIEKDLIKKEKLGDDLHLEALRDNFIQIIDIAKRVEQCDLSRAPYAYLVNYNNTIGDTENLFTQIKQFSVSSGNPVNQKNSFVNQVQSRIDILIEHSSPIFIIELLKGNDLSLEKAKIQSLLDEIGKEKETSQKEIDGIKKELKETLDSAKRAAAEVGVAQHSLVFKTESEYHFLEAKKWLKSTIGILAATIVAGVIFMFWTPSSNEGTTHLVQFTITKVVVLAVIFMHYQ